jgi:hypothetical protein
MNLTRDRVRSIGWAFVLTVCAGALLALTFRVNAVKSKVRLAERQLVALQQEKLFLETEFEARSNQQQLKALNDVEFGYEAPRAEQYIEGERQLVALGKARAPGAPTPIRVASAAEGPGDLGGQGAFPAMVSPLTGKAAAAEVPEGGPRKQVDSAGLSQRLARINLREGREDVGTE